MTPQQQYDAIIEWLDAYEDTVVGFLPWLGPLWALQRQQADEALDEALAGDDGPPWIDGPRRLAALYAATVGGGG